MRHTHIYKKEDGQLEVVPEETYWPLFAVVAYFESLMIF